MNKWSIIASVLIVGIATVLGVWFFVKVSTEEVPTDVEPGERQTFFSFFGEQFGFIDKEEPPATTTDPVTERVVPDFRSILAREQMLPISDELLAGATFMMTWEATTTALGETATITEEFVRYVERETGHISDLSLISGFVRRATNTTVPRIQEAVWGANGSAVALRYLSDDNETIETYVAPLATSTNATTTDLVGTFFPRNIASIAFGPDAAEIFYIRGTSNGAIGHLTNLAHTSDVGMFSSTLREWLAVWSAPDRITVYSKPSVLASGVAQFVGRDGTITRITTGQGLTVLPNPNGTRVLYAIAGPQTLRTYIVDIDAQETTELTLRTLPEKCAWIDEARLVCAIPNATPDNVPDAWYQGKVMFTDALWVIDAATEQMDFIFAPEDTAARQEMDITNIDVSSDGTIISFINKKDLRGWLADITSTNN